MKRIVGYAILLNFALVVSAQSALVRPSSLAILDSGECSRDGRTCTITLPRNTPDSTLVAIVSEIFGERPIMASTKSISLPSLGPNAATTVLTIIDGAPRIAPPALSGLNIVGEFAAPAALSSATEIETDVLSSVPEVEEVIETPVPPAAPIMLLGLAAIAGFVRRRL